MTVTYSLHVSRARLSAFPKLLLRWKGSIYKLLYKEMLIFCALYYGLLILYRLVLNESQCRVFEKLAIYCEAFTDLIPLSFVLGFYVTIVVSRWWNQFLAIPWPDKVCMLISAYVHGNDERGRMIRRTLARYLSLMSALTYQAVSTAVKKRFPTLEHIVEAGLMTKEEQRVYDGIQIVHGKWWVPAQWFTSLAVRARKEGRIKDNYPLKQLLDEMHVFRGNCGLLFAFDWISIPLVYTQVVTLAIYTYFLATVMGRQYLDPKKGYPGHDIDLYVPVFTLLQFFFYMGWLKVAEQLINPFGEDDDDFEMNWCLDRNLQLSFNIVDEMHQVHPRLVKDIYWDEAEPQLPYTRSSFNLRSQPHLGSAMNLDVDPAEAEFITLDPILEEDKEENNYNSPPRSPAYDYRDPVNFSTPSTMPAKRSEAVDPENENPSLQRSRLPEFSKILNMVIGSNRDLSHNSTYEPEKEGTHGLPSAPFILKPPCGWKKQSFESVVNHFGDDKCSDEQITSTICHRSELGSKEEQENLLSVHCVLPERSNGQCSIMVSDLLSAAKEDSSVDPRLSSHMEESQTGHLVLNIESEIMSGSPESLHLCKPSNSEESLVTSDSSQSTVNSYSELLEHEV